MWFRQKVQPSTLDQDFISRYWDLVGRVDSLEAHLDDRLNELEKRYKRSEQAERRLQEKRELANPCEDDHVGAAHPALGYRRSAHATSPRIDIEQG